LQAAALLLAVFHFRRQARRAAATSIPPLSAPH